jgi:hypothetical protein
MAFFRGDGGAGTGDVTSTPFNIAEGGTGASTVPGARANLGLGTAATTNADAYATAAQGALADSAVQPGSLSTVATSGDYDDLLNKPTLGTAAATDATDYATAAQGALADSATQPGDLATVATSGDYDDLSNKPSLFSGDYDDLTNKPSIPATLTDLGIVDGSNGQTLTTDGAGTFSFTSAGLGTVTSVAATVPTGLAVSGSPITSSGTLAITYDTGYAIPTTAKQTEWDTAYGWGDHALVGYLTTETYTGTVTSVAATVPTGFVVSGSPITASGTLAVTFDTGYALPTTASQSNWDTAYGWGDHAAAGYLDSGDIGVTVQAYDANILTSSAIGVTVQGYDADTAKYDDVTANFTGTLQNGGNTVLTTASTIEGGTFA